MVAEREAAAEKYRNWGKWGPDDQLGTLNYITPEQIVAAARLVRKGALFSLAIPLDRNGPQIGLAGGRFNPIHMMTMTGTDALATGPSAAVKGEGSGYGDDLLILPLQAGTQWDGFGHVFDRGKMWNGYGAEEVTARGAQRNGIEHWRDKIVGRGVLLDVARSKSVETLEPGYAVTEDDLFECAESAGVTVGPGDIVLVRTGWMGQCKANGWGTYGGGNAPGLSFGTCDWLHRTQIAAIATDTWGVEVRPSEVEGWLSPLHFVAIPNIGLVLGEIFDLDDLAADCAEDGVYEFLLVAPPLPITGAVGSPVNPIAIK